MAISCKIVRFNLGTVYLGTQFLMRSQLHCLKPGQLPIQELATPDSA